MANEKTKNSDFENTLFSGLGLSIMTLAFSIAYICNVGNIKNIIPGLSPYSWKILWLSIIAVVIILILLNIRIIGKGILGLLKMISTAIFKGFKSTVKEHPFQNGKISKSQKLNYTGTSFKDGLPPLSLLGSLEGYVESRNNAENTKTIINKLFKDFNLDCNVGSFQVGPTVTRFYLNLSPTLKIRDVMSLQEDLAARIKCRNVRIATTNGIFIEVPNKEKQNVTQREIMEELRTKNLPQLAMVCGRSGAGDAYFVDLSKAPHLLVGGATGGGKSVCVNSLIVTLLMRNTPDDLKFIMIDPKVIELEFYQNLPHLLFPVANSLEKSVEVLRWCVKEMNRRYIELRNIKKKNLIDIPVKERPFPIIIIVIDELAELTMSKEANELIDSLNSLARMARAAGMYMILATQRPDKDAIPGQLKSNIPSSIALKVKHDYESKIILGQMGAEKLVGKGDMLINMNGEEELVRCQGSFLKDENIEAVVNWWIDNWSGSTTTTAAAEPTSKPKIVFDLSEPESADTGEENINGRTSARDAAELALRQSICQSVLTNGDSVEIQLPTIRELSEELEISTRQVSYILEQLKSENWIVQKGKTSDAKVIVSLSKDMSNNWLEKNNFQ